jgi:thymidylate synthase
MTFNITCSNVNEAFSEMFWKLRTRKVDTRQTRNGPALTFEGTFIISYLRPNERVLFHPGRDANPIFHLLESVWMLAGRNDVAFLEQFNSRIGQYSDDGVTFNAAYGYRWRRHFGFDQLKAVIELLKKDPNTRQAVIQMWDATDLIKTTKDKACNTQIVFEARHGRLNVTVFNRSNDIWWGACGANAVHFSVLQEFIATSAGLTVGLYRQVSSNMHLYTELYDAQRYVEQPPSARDFDYYWLGQVTPRALMSYPDPELFLYECEWFCVDPFANNPYKNAFLSHTARQLALVSAERRAGRSGLEEARAVGAADWRRAAIEWVQRREEKKHAG